MVWYVLVIDVDPSRNVFLWWLVSMLCKVSIILSGLNTITIIGIKDKELENITEDEVEEYIKKKKQRTTKAQEITD